MNSNLWVERQLNYRFANISKTRCAILPLHEEVKTRLNRISLLVASERRFSKFNGFDTACLFDVEQHKFVLSDAPNSTNYRREVRFANLVLSWGFNNAILANWNDAQGWGYQNVVPELDSIPIIQFARRKEQRDRVVLFPLPKEYMGPGSDGLPIDFDPLSFQKKKDKLIWRGRYSGALGDWNSRKNPLTWAMTIFREESDIVDPEKKKIFSSMPRYRVLKDMNCIKWADLGFVLSEKELKAVQSSHWKAEFLMPYTKPRLSVADQIQNKFILAMPGNDYSTSLYWSLCSNSVVFLLENEWETILDSGLEPWVHYVPVSNEKGDIEVKFEKMLKNPKLCLEIIENAHQYIKPFLDLDLRDAVDYETLRRYQDLTISVIGLNKDWSYARHKTLK